MVNNPQYKITSDYWLTSEPLTIDIRCIIHVSYELLIIMEFQVKKFLGIAQNCFYYAMPIT